jgi:imidazolonepropionase-like amidohydrolase
LREDVAEDGVDLPALAAGAGDPDLVLHGVAAAHVLLLGGGQALAGEAGRGGGYLGGLLDLDAEVVKAGRLVRRVGAVGPDPGSVGFEQDELERRLGDGEVGVAVRGLRAVLRGADYGMAQAIDEGLAIGPRLVFGGKALSQTGGHGDIRPLGDDSAPCCQSRPAFARIADGVDAVRAAARDEFRKGAAHLKMLISGGVASPHDEVSAVQYTDEEIRAAVTEAEHHNRYVTVHAYHPRGVNRALRAGVRCVEHGNLIDDETISLLLENDAYLVPTLVTYDQMAEFGKRVGMPEQSYKKIADVHEAALGSLEQAYKAGVNLVYGSDLLGPLHPAQLEEFTLRAEVQPAADVIRSATSTAARLLRMEGEIGTLAPGAHADLLVVDGDPLADLAVLTRPERHLRHVVKAGSVL